MRRFEISPVVIAAMRSRALAASIHEVGVPLQLEMPRYGDVAATYFEAEQDNARRLASPGVDREDDDDFY